MTTTTAPPRPTLDIAKVRNTIARLQPLVGGWGTPHPTDPERSHYFRDSGEGTTDGITLCGFQDERTAIDVDDCDPLAPENCPACRRELLTLRGLL